MNDRIGWLLAAAAIVSTAIAADAPYPGMQPLVVQLAIDIAGQRIEGGWAC